MNEKVKTAVEKEPVFNGKLLEVTVIQIEGKLFRAVKETIVEAPMSTFNQLKTTKFEILKE